jgi:hypothetical protein
MVDIAYILVPKPDRRKRRLRFGLCSLILIAPVIAALFGLNFRSEASLEMHRSTQQSMYEIGWPLSFYDGEGTRHSINFEHLVINVIFWTDLVAIVLVVGKLVSMALRSGDLEREYVRHFALRTPLGSERFVPRIPAGRHHSLSRFFVWLRELVRSTTRILVAAARKVTAGMF